MGLFGQTSRASHLELWRDMQVVVWLCAQITLGTPLVWHFIEYQRQDISSKNMYVCLRKQIWSWILVFLEVKSPKAHLLPSASHFCFPPSVFLFWAVLTSLKHSTLLSAMFVFICVPPNHPINARVLSLGPRLSLFSEGSYLLTETFLYDLSCSFDDTFSAIYPDTAMPTFLFPLIGVLKRQSSHNSIVWRFKTIPQTVVNRECLTSETTTTPKSKIVASVETTEEVDYTMDESNEKDTVEEDVYLTVFPRYALNYLLNLPPYLFD